MRQADICGIRFAFWDTITDQFIRSKYGFCGWDSTKDLEADFLEDQNFLQRLKGLSPPWTNNTEDTTLECLATGL